MIGSNRSAVRVTHLPTGLTATCSSERSQLHNRQIALSTLMSKVADHYRQLSNGGRLVGFALSEFEARSYNGEFLPDGDLDPDMVGGPDVPPKVPVDEMVSDLKAMIEALR